MRTKGQALRLALPFLLVSLSMFPSPSSVRLTRKHVEEALGPPLMSLRFLSELRSVERKQHGSGNPRIRADVYSYAGACAGPEAGVEQGARANQGRLRKRGSLTPRSGQGPMILLG